ncbi:O-antigen ligase C-terminal domain-containing protein [Rhodoferax sp. 4810]|nr:O-antigen ligase C-terminal domain-containing protein [Rhodoferax jenense]
MASLLNSEIDLSRQPDTKGCSKPPMSSFWLTVFVCTLGIAWLLPNHYPPWTSFHSDLWSAITWGLAAFVVILRRELPIYWHPTAVLVACLACVPWLQYSIGLIDFAGQAWLSTIFILGLLLGLLVGQRWEQACPDQLIDGLFLAIGIASVLSVSLQLQAWLGLMDTGVFDIWWMGLSGNRPYANLGQPNQLATLLLWGILATAWGYTKKKIGVGVSLLLISYLLIGIALTQSRTAWLALTLLLTSTWVWRGLWSSRWVPWFVTGLFLGFLALPTVLKEISDLLLLASDQSYFRDPMQEQLRPLAWRLFLQAAWDQPWHGYGWAPVGHAQLTVAQFFSPLFGTFTQSHNLFLDLVLWLGLPMGLFVSVFLIWNLLSYFQRVSNAKDAILLLFLGVVGIHAMLELPLHYAYFLLPTGMVIGVLNQRLGGASLFSTPRWSAMLLWLCSMALLALVIVDYFKIESGFQKVRFELARVGTLPIGKPVKVVLLDQLSELIDFIRFEPEKNMTQEKLAWMVRVTNAYPTGSSVYKTARAFALNAQPEEAQLWLTKICKISPVEECNSSRNVWGQEALSNPSIALVQWPN